MGGGRLLRNGQVRKVIGPHLSSDPDVAQAGYRSQIDVELLPLGTLAEAIRAGGTGTSGSFTPAGAETRPAEGEGSLQIDGREMIPASPLRGDVALLRAWKAGTAANLV